MTQFNDLFEFTFEMNKVFIDLAGKADNPKAALFMNHILNAQEIWMDRVLDGKADIGAWDIYAGDLHTRNEQLFRRTMSLLEQAYPVSIEYSNSRGATFKNRTKDILYHIVNHSTHHRAQIASLASEQGLEVPPSDFIFYKRN